MPHSPVQPFTHLLKQLHNALRSAVEQALAPTGLSFPEASVLVELSVVPRRSNAELARASFVAPQSMVTLLQNLESRGLIARRPSPKGGRAMLAELTPQGTKHLMVFYLAMRQVEHRLLGSLAREDQVRLKKLLERCLESMRPVHATK